jgi:hypothetical protein
MLPHDAHAPLTTGDRALTSPTFQQQQVGFLLGHSLRGLYEDLVKAPIPVHLQTIVARLEPRTVAELQPRRFAP